MPRKHYWSAGSGRSIELSLTLEDAASGSHPGDCADDVEALSRVPYVAEQIADWDPADLIDELSEYGAWEDDELQDHATNVQRMLWLACNDITEEARACD